LPKIEIDESKCLTPFVCKKCLQVCPHAVFAVAPKEVLRFKETDPQEPGSYRLFVVYRDKCVVCNDCVEVCPVNAIKITLPEGA
jgi:NAD-dependent dihydropyrimidine dehydrogenase PreA subunit